MMTATETSAGAAAALPPTPPSVTRQQLLAALAQYRRAHPRAAVALLAFDLAVYAGLWLAVVLAPAVWMKIPLAVLCSMAVARLFVFGHDACHGSAFGSRWSNAIAGRLAFLPSLTPFSTWELGHNTLHHGFTNLRGKDYVYTPLSPAEYHALPGWRRALERLYRHPLGGSGICYLVEVWWKKLWFPRRPHLEQEPRLIYTADSLLTLAFAAAQIAAAAALSPAAPAVAALTAVALPFLGWNLLMGFVTYQHHTHPGVVWYASRADWDPVAAQLENTVHVGFPPVIGALLGNIMEHTAHHLDVRIPLFELPAAQRAIESLFPRQVIRVEPWSWRAYSAACRTCQLYDYENRRWLPFKAKWGDL